MARYFTTTVRSTGGTFKSGLLGFCIGLAGSSSLAYVYLLQQQNVVTDALLTSMEDLTSSVDKVKKQLLKIDKLESDISLIKKEYSNKVEVEHVRREVLKQVDDVVIDLQDLKTKIVQ